MDESEKEVVQEVFSSVHPYLNRPSGLEEAIEDISEESSDLDEFERKFDSLISEQEDPSTKADYRIFINKFRSR